jgi:uncharacterized protein
MRQLALVTGASSGIGLELARQFAENGFDVVAGSAKNKAQVAAGKLLPETARARLHAVQTRPDQDD